LLRNKHALRKHAFACVSHTFRFLHRDRAYAAEELVAELAAAFLCAEFGFDNDLRHAGYIASWIELLKGRQAGILHRSEQGTSCGGHLRGLALQEPIANAA
jgi:antirestriction protein ArdC